eukprot:25934-Chlamydomonas_euryale.AAC.2
MCARLTPAPPPTTHTRTCPLSMPFSRSGARLQPSDLRAQTRATGQQGSRSHLRLHRRDLAAEEVAQYAKHHPARQRAGLQGAGVKPHTFAHALGGRSSRSRCEATHSHLGTCGVLLKWVCSRAFTHAPGVSGAGAMPYITLRHARGGLWVARVGATLARCWRQCWQNVGANDGTIVGANVDANVVTNVGAHAAKRGKRCGGGVRCEEGSSHAAILKNAQIDDQLPDHLDEMMDNCVECESRCGLVSNVDPGLFGCVKGKGRHVDMCCRKEVWTFAAGGNVWVCATAHA